MSERANLPELEAQSKILLDHLFYQRFTALETIGKPRLKLSVQQQIRQLKERIENFMKNNRYAFFNIVVLENNDVNKPLNGIMVRNFKLYVDDIEPNKYLIAIEPTWTQCQVFQLSPTGLKIQEILI